MHMGLDAEFLILNKNVPLDANDYMRDMGGHFGKDGSGRPFEIRPEPCDSVAGLIKQIHGCLSAGYTYLLAKDFVVQDTKWVTQSIHHPLGAHLHFNLMEDQYQDHWEMFCHTLDHLVTLPLSLKADAKCLQERFDHGYGLLPQGDDSKDSFRRSKKFASQCAHLEYRPPWGFWADPVEAEIILQTYFNVACFAMDRSRTAGLMARYSLRKEARPYPQSRPAVEWLKALEILKQEGLSAPGFEEYIRDPGFAPSECILERWKPEKLKTNKITTVNRDREIIFQNGWDELMQRTEVMEGNWRVGE